MMHCETTSETTSNRDSLSLINHSLVSLQFKQDSFKFTVSLSKRKSWPTWAIKNHGVQSDFNFKAGFLPRASSRFCSGTDKIEVLPQADGVGDLVLHLCSWHRSGYGGREWILGGSAGGRTGGRGEISGAVGDNHKVAGRGGGLESQGSGGKGGLCVSPH